MTAAGSLQKERRRIRCRHTHTYTNKQTISRAEFTYPNPSIVGCVVQGEWNSAKATEVSRIACREGTYVASEG